MNNIREIEDFQQEIKALECKHREEMYRKEEEIKIIKERLNVLEIKWSVVELFLKEK